MASKLVSLISKIGPWQVVAGIRPGETSLSLMDINEPHTPASVLDHCALLPSQFSLPPRSCGDDKVVNGW